MFKKGDLVRIISKSSGKGLSQIERYDITRPQEIKYILKAREVTIYVIRGDYYLEQDLEPYFSFTDRLDDKLFEI